MESLWRDSRHATRALVARPTYTVMATVTLALVVGAATAVLAVIDRTLVRPLPFKEGERLVNLYTQPPGTTRVADRNPLQPRTFLRFRTGGFPSVDAIEGMWARERAIGADGEPESVPAALVSAGALPLLGGSPALGRSWTEAEDQANARLVVISHGLWQRRFGGDPGIIGRTLAIDRETHEIIGVMPSGFRLAFIDSELWTPLNMNESQVANMTSVIQTVARLRVGSTLAQLNAEIAPALAAVVAEDPNRFSGWTGGATRLRDWQFGQQRPALIALLMAVATLALLATVNLANLTLAQVLSRRAEFGLRAALGAGQASILRLQMVESVVIGVAGCVAGLLLGAALLPMVLALDPQTARLLGAVSVDWRVQMMATLIGVGVSIVAGTVPLVRELRQSPGVSAAGLRIAGSRRDDRVRLALVTVETALTVILLAAGAFLVNGFERGSRIHPGFDPSSVMTAQIRLAPIAYPTEAARSAFVFTMLDRIREVPGVTAAATTQNLFRPGFTFQTLIHIEHQPTPDGQPHTVLFRRVSPFYFATLRIPLLRGRDFTRTDHLDTMPVAIVSQSFVDQHWPHQDPLGRRLRRNTPKPSFVTVVGVVGDVSDVGLQQPPMPTLYLPYSQTNVVTAPIGLVVRTAGEPLALTSAVRGAVLAVDPAQPLDKIDSLEQFLGDSLGPQRFRSTLLLMLAGLGLLIAAVGIYGVTARAVEERAREVGVRMALGAAPSAVWRLLVQKAMTAVLAGVALGGVVATGVVPLIASLLPNLEEATAWSAVPATALLVAAGLVASGWPARRATHVDPVVVLRGD